MSRQVQILQLLNDSEMYGWVLTRQTFIFKTQIQNEKPVLKIRENILSFCLNTITEN